MISDCWFNCSIVSEDPESTVGGLLAVGYNNNVEEIAALEKKPASTKPGTSDKSPQTGDSSNLVLWISLLFASGGAAIGTTVVSRKKKYNR